MLNPDRYIVAIYLHQLTSLINYISVEAHSKILHGEVSFSGGIWRESSTHYIIGKIRYSY